MTTANEFFQAARDYGVYPVAGAHASVNGQQVLVTKPHQFKGLRWLKRDGGSDPGRHGKRGSGMIAIATGLLFALGAGLLAVSLAAQYTYLQHERHQNAASLIEALALDLGMLIFSLLALGLARSGKTSRVERALIIACAAGSAAMNLAAADVASPRSVLAYTMPPIFLAVVADRVISVVRRHYLADADASAWTSLRTGLVVSGKASLYLLRLLVAPVSTVTGARNALLNATTLPSLAAPKAKLAIEPAIKPADPPAEDAGQMHGPWHKFEASAAAAPAQVTAPREGTKTATFLALVAERHGPLAAFPLENVSRIAGEIAPEAELHPGSARKALKDAVVAAQAGGAA